LRYRLPRFIKQAGIEGERDVLHRGLTELERLAVGFGVSTGSGLSRIKGLGWAKG